MNKIELSPYLHFNGNCEEAMNFYKSIFGGELEISRFGQYEAPMPMDDEQKNKVMHSTLKDGPVSFMASDGMPGVPVTFGDNVTMSLGGMDEPTLTAYFNGLSEGGKVTQPLEKQMWGDVFGMVTDKYGIHWFVNIGNATEKQE